MGYSVKLLDSDLRKITATVQYLKDRDQHVKLHEIEEQLLHIAQQALSTAKETNVKYESLSRKVKEESERLCGVSRKVDEDSRKLEGISKKVDEESVKLDGVSKKVDEESVKLDGVSRKVDEDSVKLNGVSKKVDEESVKLDGVSEKVQQVDHSASDFNQLAERVSQLEKQVKAFGSGKTSSRYSLRSTDRLDCDGNATSYDNFIGILRELIDKYLIDRPEHPKRPPATQAFRSRSRSYSCSSAEPPIESEQDDVFTDSPLTTRNSGLRSKDRFLLVSIRRMLSEDGQ